MLYGLLQSIGFELFDILVVFNDYAVDSVLVKIVFLFNIAMGQGNS